jgi:hypothetical protein
MGGISGDAAADVNSIFELEIVPLSEIAKNPSAYDSTMAYRKISVIGNVSEINKSFVSIVQDGYELKVDCTNDKLFAGFNVGDGIKLTGQFIYDSMGTSIFYPKYVLHYPIQRIDDVNITDIISNPNMFNGKYVRVTGNITEIKPTMGEYIVELSNGENQQSLRVFYYGATEVKAGDLVTVTGLINGGNLYSEQMGKKRPPLSLSTFIPGFTCFWTIFIFGLLVIYMKHE